MRTLEQTLALVPAVYAELGEALTPGRGSGEGSGSPDPLHKPAPARLDGVEHRHLLLRGLRWWVDAVSDPGPGSAPIGDSVAHMCARLMFHLPSMAPEDRATMAGNLNEWLDGAYPLVGRVAVPLAPLPREALTQRVPVHVAAEVLGVSVRTVQRRAPDRVDGLVLLADAAGPVCEFGDLPEPWCDHCRPAANGNTVRAGFA